MKLIGSQFKEFFPLQMGDTRRGEGSAHAHTHTKFGRDIFLFHFPKAPTSTQICPLGGKNGNNSKLKCFRDVREKPENQIDCGENARRTSCLSTAVRRNSLKSRLLGNKNKPTYFQIESCPVFAGSYSDTGCVSNSVCLLRIHFM